MMIQPCTKRWVLALVGNLTLLVTSEGFMIPRRTTFRHHEPSNVCLSTASKDIQEHYQAIYDKILSTEKKSVDPEEVIYQEIMLRPANDIKRELTEKRLSSKGRKPDLARRLAEYISGGKGSRGKTLIVEEDEEIGDWTALKEMKEGEELEPMKSFAGIRLSKTGGLALARANFRYPSPIQKIAIPCIRNGQDCILHAPTGSGKTLAYLLPFTESLLNPSKFDEPKLGLVLLPTRELAAQVAGIASSLAPPGSVRLISHPTNLMRSAEKDRGGLSSPHPNPPRLFIGSAKAIMVSIFGDGELPAPPTTRPEGQFFLSNVGYLVLDETDRILGVRKSRPDKKSKKHEKPAGVLTAAVMRMSTGTAQIVAVSATVGRPLKRELSRVLGIPPQDCPVVLRSDEDTDALESDDGGRSVKIPDTVSHYVVATDGTSAGATLTVASFVCRQLQTRPHCKVLVVLSRGCGMEVKHAVGALRSMGCRNPMAGSLLDRLETGGGTDQLMHVHQKVSGATGIGESSTKTEDERYLFITGEDSVRGLHLDGLDTVVVVGRPKGPDEYTHIAGRTGRAGRNGNVINVMSYQQKAAIPSWEQMLGVEFHSIDESEVGAL